MGWKIINGRRYFYKSERDGGRVRTTYYGGGESARQISLSLGPRPGSPGKISKTSRPRSKAAELAGLLSASEEPGRKLVASVLDVPEPEATSGRRPLYGPIPWAWWLPASRLPGKSLQVASVCWLLAGRERSAEFELALDDWAEFGLSRFSASRGLDTLERGGLVSVVRRTGRSLVVSILDLPAGVGNRPIS